MKARGHERSHERLTAIDQQIVEVVLVDLQRPEIIDRRKPSRHEPLLVLIGGCSWLLDLRRLALTSATARGQANRRQ